MNIESIYVAVESSKQAKAYRQILKSLGQPISSEYFPWFKGCNLQTSISGSWILADSATGEKISFGSLVDLLERKPLLISEDGVELYEKSPYWLVSLEHGKVKLLPEEGELMLNHTIFRFRNILKAFSTKQAALKWIESQKPEYVDLHTEDLFTDRVYAHRLEIHGDFDKTTSDHVIVLTREHLLNIMETMEGLRNG